jgi:hypothetical protein
MLQHQTDPDYPELEAMLMAFVDDVRSQCTATEPLERLRQLATDHRARMVRAPTRVG